MALAVLAVSCSSAGASSAPSLPPSHGAVASPTPAPAAPETPSPRASYPATSWVAAENARPGTPGWEVTRPAQQHEIEGYASAVSALPGVPVSLYVSTTARTFNVAAVRLGWYGGTGGRVVWQSGPLAGRRQPAPVVQGSTRTVTAAAWGPSLQLPTTDWPPGAYVLRLDASDGLQSSVPLTLRTQDNHDRLVVLDSVATWQAYNGWGGYDLYAGPDGSFAHRSYAVSFDRPYSHDFGAGRLLTDDAAVIRLAERLGLDLGYATDLDLQTHPGLLAGARAVVTTGHSEYWSPAMRAALTAARDAGANLAFLGANAMFRRIRLEPTATGPDRLEVDYKDSSLDPVTATDPSAATSDWPAAPDPRPQEAVTGDRYECNPVETAWRVVEPVPWLFAGSGLHSGSELPQLVAPEYDRAAPSPLTPRPLQVLAHSPVVCGGVHSFADTAYYTAPSGAGVFATGTMRWVSALAKGVGPTTAQRQATARAVTAITAHLLRAFAAGPAARTHPAHDTLPRFETYAGDPVAAHHDLW